MRFKIVRGVSLLFALIVMMLFENCTVNQQIAKRIDHFLNESPVLSDHHVGFALSDLDGKKMIYQKDAAKYFIPASNMKLFTFYAGLKLIPDSIPSLRYIERGDSLIFWGTGDPSLLEWNLRGDRAMNFLKNSHKQLFFAPGRYTGNTYGMGWSWDDYNDYFQAEISELPLMDNLLILSKEKGKISVMPRYFKDCLLTDSLVRNKDFLVTRKVDENKFSYPAGLIPEGFSQPVPYKTSTQITLNVLRDTLGLPVQLIALQMPSDAKTIYNMKSEDVFRAMLLPSDNFIAEQLLLVYANQLRQQLNSTEVIQYILDKYLKMMPDRPRWVDGSGLSRMNLVSPRDMVLLLQLIDREMNNREKLFSMLPAGGKRGTLKNAYPQTDHPFVFGKTGTFSNNYNQSGYIQTKKGRTLVFSFMNNNFMDPIRDVKAEMAALMTYIHDNF